MTELRSIAVIGAGTMGSGITYAAVSAGLAVSLHEAAPASSDEVVARIAGMFDAAIIRGKSTRALKDEGVARLTVVADIATAVRDADVMIEAVPEALSVKQAVFVEAERHARTDAILASNTSSLSVSAIAGVLTDPGRLVGMHFFNPVHAMRLVEVVRGMETRDAAVATALAVADRLGKTCIVVRDTPGFATSRLGVVLGLEAIRMLEQGVASAEDIDRAMSLGYNHPVGPLRLTDIVGLDIRLAVAEHLHRTLGADTYRPPELLKRLVADGRLGRKTGRGFFDWENDR